jgi:hypothetical protein
LEKSVKAVSSTRDGHECSLAAGHQYRTCLSYLPNQRDLLSLQPRAERRERGDRRLAGTVDREQAHVGLWPVLFVSAQRAGLSPTCAGSHHPGGPKASHALTFKLDHSSGAAHPARAAKVEKSSRGELEIPSLLESYLADGELVVERMGRGYAWLDTGTHASLLDAGNFVRTLSNRQGLQTGSPDEVAFLNGWIDRAALLDQAARFAKNDYGKYLQQIAND